MKKLYAKHFELNFPDRASASRFYMISKELGLHQITTLITSDNKRFRKPVNYVYLEEAIELANKKIKRAIVPRVKKAWINMLERLNYINDNYFEAYEETVEAKKYIYKEPNENFITRRALNYTLKKMRQQQFLKKWNMCKDKMFHT